MLANARIEIEPLYGPLILWALRNWQKPGQRLHLALDTMMLWNQYSENEWHWVRDVQLGEDAHRYAERNGVQALALLRTLGLNLLRTNGF